MRVRVATLFAFTTYYCLVFLRLARCILTTSSFATCVRQFFVCCYIYLLVLFLTYIYLPLDKGVAGGIIDDDIFGVARGCAPRRPGEIRRCRDSGWCRALPLKGRLSWHLRRPALLLRVHRMHVATDAFCVANVRAHCRVCLNTFMCH